MKIAVATASDLDFICSNFPKIRPLPAAIGDQCTMTSESMLSLLKSKSNPLYQLWQFAVATVDSGPVGFIQTLDFRILKEHLSYCNLLGIYDVRPEVLEFRDNLRVINSIYVEDGNRMNGIGRSLMRSQKDRYRDRMGILYSEHNNENIKFYYSCGFSEYYRGAKTSYKREEIFLMLDGQFS
ncbi:GNAT family N-acetyltransferase [Rhizobium sp. K102]|uniref:GNAT family N-acetyltransferase n=1 Tax=Rhizobium sp. K102 TaxID=2918527 RepID=UPI001EFAE728|nr:GNAT family N-acetyltransferase [Rhizobium sp. K102]ULR42948.1 GNAT family N-acetyltransferase [Rhizobium sp. K102]